MFARAALVDQKIGEFKRLYPVGSMNVITIFHGNSGNLMS